MSKFESTNFKTSTGRLVYGSPYDPITTDYEGKPLTIKSGPNIGQPTKKWDFGVAFAKLAGEANWWDCELGKIVAAQGIKDHPAASQRPDFAWKVVDGDSTVPNKKGSRPCDKPGYPGHWVFSFSSQKPPKVVNSDASAYLIDKDAVRPGDYVQVAGSVVGNEGASPGVYLNHIAIALQGHHPEGYISQGPDLKTVGFGQGPQPNMVQVPVGGMSAPAPAMSAPPQVPFAQPNPPAPPAVPAAPTPMPVVPHATILVPPIAAPAPAPAPVAAGPQMTAKAVTTYAEYIKAGWTDALLRRDGYML